MCLGRVVGHFPPTALYSPHSFKGIAMPESGQELPAQNGRRISVLIAIISTTILILTFIGGTITYARSVMVERSERVDAEISKRDLILEKHEERIRKVENSIIRQETLLEGIDTRQQRIEILLEGGPP